MLKKFVLLFIIIFAGSLFYFSKQELSEQKTSSEKPQKMQSAGVKVIVKPVEFTENNRTFETIGTGQAKLSAEIYPAVEDEVVAVNFNLQQKVKKGDVLVKLDDREEKLAVRLREVELKDARALLNRYEEAVKEGAVPQSQVDTTKAEYEAARVALDQAKLDLAYHEITAPFDGYVGIPTIDIGDRIGPQTMITGLDQRDMLYIHFEVPETLVGQLHQAMQDKQEITLRTPSFPQREFTGTISAIEGRVNEDSRTITTRVVIDNKDDLLRPGMSFSTKWVIKGDKFATVPEIALQWAKEGSFIWLIRNGKAEKVMTSVKARKSGNVLLEGDINDGDQVVVEGLQRLKPDSDVQILGGGNE